MLAAICMLLVVLHIAIGTQLEAISIDTCPGVTFEINKAGNTLPDVDVVVKNLEIFILRIGKRVSRYHAIRELACYEF